MTRLEELESALKEARAANERDRTEVIMAVNAINDEFARRRWLFSSRGSYEWDDDRYQQEFRDAIEALEPHVERLRKIGADRSNCPETQAEVDEAPADGWVLVPQEPTEAMRQAGIDAAMAGEIYAKNGGGTIVVETSIARHVYSAMIAAAPASPAASQGGASQ